jgi:outer membrane autotransporter protein
MKMRSRYNASGQNGYLGQSNRTTKKSRRQRQLTPPFVSAMAGLGLLFFSCSVYGQAVPLGEAGNFSIISSAGLTNTGILTVVNGNIALTPTTSLTGFPPGTITGTVHYNDLIAQNAMGDGLTAYNTLAGTAFTTNLTDQDLGGMTLAPGVYHFNSSAGLTGALTLATGADPNAVFIFQIGSSLTTASTSSVVVTGAGAGIAPNIFWQVGSSATVGTGTAFAGNIFALASITMTTGSTLSNGRLVALNGAVTLDNIVVAALPVIPAAPGRYWNGLNGNTWSGINWSTTVAGLDHVVLGSNVDVVFSVTPTPINQNTNLDTNVTISSLTVNDSAAVTIGGSNKLTISSTGLITGININNGAGRTTISSKLELGYLSQVITVNNAAGMLISGVVSGTNGLTKAGTGVLTLTGVETYTGATVVSGGTLQLGNGVIAGSSIASSNSILTAPAGTLSLNLANGETFSQNVTDNGQIRWIAPGTNTQASTSVFSGTGGMQVDSMGTAVILGKNTYTGATVITDGTLQLGNGVTVGSAIASTSSILIAPDGVLALNLANGETFSQNVTDNGQIRWIAPGTNTQASTSVFSGTGSMLITAPTSTVLLGDNSFSGGTTINTPGDVYVGNVSSNTSSPFGSGVLTINNGTIDTVNSQLLQMEVGGYVQTGGEIAMHLEGVGAGDYTRYLVAGSANLSGGTVFVYDLSGNYVPYGGDMQNIIRTTDGLQGEFASNTPESHYYNEAFDLDFYYHQGDTLLYPTITYDPDNAYVTWVQDSFQSVPDLTPNQDAVGGGLDDYVDQNSGLPDDIVAYLNGQNIANLPAMYDLIAPDELTAIFQMGFTSAGVQNASVQRHLERVRRSTSSSTLSTRSYRDSKGGLAEETVTTHDTNRWSFFFEGTGGSADVDGDSNASGYDFDSTGGMLGADMRVNDNLVIGILGSYANSDANLINGGSIDAENYSVAAYATAYKNGYFLDALIGAGFNSYDTKRSSMFGYAEGSPDGWQLNSMLNTGYDFRRGKWTLTPNASVAYTRVSLDSFDETGSLTPLSYPTQDQDSLRSELGLTLAYAADINGIKVTPQVRIAWQHEFMDSTQSMNSRFIGGTGPTFTVSGPHMDRDRAVLSAGISAEITPSVTIYGFYDGQLGSSNYNSNQVSAGVKIAF